MKDKMTPTPWEVREPITHMFASIIAAKSLDQVDSYVAAIFKSDDCEMNASAIVSAVNNTYGSGINPEAVPELLRALKEVISVSDRKTDIYDRAKAAIKKARN